ncbi:uncharacterized protein LOC111245215 isoform X4 [Varroa destructor]|uniref:Chitin-binding type-2 domain-containing protein n=1 Tax=Varroa destructor TaxID=109461 RepID=A0A7M7JKW5_VARDE|nr:uncharacterized protein LOC111245215 isoform X4 [Varroa destructor]
MGYPVRWTILLASISVIAFVATKKKGILHALPPAEAQLIKFPRLRWPSFNRGNKKDSAIELKGSSTNHEPSVTHTYVGGSGGQSSSPSVSPPLGPPLPAGLPPSLGPPPPLYGAGYGPFSPFARSPYGRAPNPFVFPNIVAPPPPSLPPPSSTYYTSSFSSGGRKSRRRRPVYDNDSLEDASTEDEPVYIKVKSRKRRPIVIDEDELLGRGHNGASSEEVDDRESKVSYKSRSKPQVVYVDSSREYQTPNERRMLLKNEEMVQDAPSYHSPAISALHASVSSGGYQINSRLQSQRQPDSVVYVNDIESSTGPSYHIDGHGDHEDHSEFSGHFLLQNMGEINQHRQIKEIPPSQKTFRIPESSTTTPTIRIVLNSLNSNSESPQMSREIMPPVTTPNPLQFSRAQIPPPQSPSSQHSSAQSMNHYQVYEPTQSVFHQQVPPTDKNQFSFDISQKRTIGWPPNASPTSFHHTPPSTLPPVPAPQLSKSNTIKVARRSFPSTFPSISTNPSAVAPSSSLNHENQMYSFPHGNSDPVQPSAIHSQDPIQVQTPMMPMNHHINYHSPQSTSVQSYHHIYDKPSSHYTEAMFFMEKPRKKTSSFVTTELPTLSHTQAHKSQQHINFSCSTRRSGYYANRMYKCQIYHHCSKRILTQTFICPNGTAFNEKQKLCEKADKVACVASDSTRIRGSSPALHQSPSQQRSPENFVEVPSFHGLLLVRCRQTLRVGRVVS